MTEIDKIDSMYVNGIVFEWFLGKDSMLAFGGGGLRVMLEHRWS